MKKAYKYIIASLAAACLAIPSFAQDEKDYTKIQTSKTVTKNDDGSYDLVLESFVTGYADENTITETKNVPLDIALVLDVSGSMGETITGVYDKTSHKVTEEPFIWNGWDGYVTLLLAAWLNGYYVHTNDDNYYPLVAYRVILGWNKYFYIDGVRHEISELDDKTLYTSVSKLEALKRATSTFIDNIAAHSTSEAEHKISIIKFAGENSNSVGNDQDGDSNYSQVVKNLTSVSSSNNVKSLKDAVNEFVAGGATHADYGMAHAEKQLEGNTTRNGQTVNKVVVMFTDGAPTARNGFQNDVANATINSSNNMKKNGVKVYTVGTFGGTPAANVNTYMDRVSSNFEDATSMTNSEAKKVESKYYMLATSNDGLNSVFSTISNDITTENPGKADVVLKTEDVVVRDVVTEHFVLPKGQESVQIQIVPAIANDDTFAGDGSYTWGEAQDAPGTIGYVINTWGENETTIDVTGFDFSNNWVGLKKSYKNNNEDKTKREVHGAKLVITINIVPNPDATGGPVKTNSEDSGIYVDGENEGNPVQTFDVPETQFIPMDLVIEKTGLANGESSIFKITRSGDDTFVMTVVLTSDGNTTTSTVTKLEVQNASGQPYVYTVEETGWAWKYNNTSTSESNSHPLYIQNGDEFTPKNTFKFGVNGKTSATNNAEHNVNNTFNE